MNVPIRSFVLAVVVCGIIAGAAFASAQFGSFNLEAPHNQVIIEWTMVDESGCTSFVIERSTDGVNYFDIATFAPHGAGEEYRYIDSDVFKQSTRTFYYRIRAEMGQASEYSDTKQIAITINTVQQTWGSLKALFR